MKKFGARRSVVLSAACGIVASATLIGSGTASASANAAPPGYAGPFTRGLACLRIGWDRPVMAGHGSWVRMQVQTRSR